MRRCRVLLACAALGSWALAAAGCSGARCPAPALRFTEGQGVVEHHGRLLAWAETLRAEMRTARGDVSLFNYGPDIETLRANCLAETGLPAPKQPQWRQSAAA